MKAWQDSAAGGGISANNIKASGDNGSSIVDRVLNVVTVKGESETWGCHRNDVYAALEGSIPKAKIDNALLELVEDGLIYCTLDDDNFKNSDQQ